MIFVGIDPGKKGGFAVVEPKSLKVIDSQAADCPNHGYIYGKGYKGIHAYNHAAMAYLFEDLIKGGGFEREEIVAVLEQQRTHPKEGRVSAFTTGYGFGLWSGILSGMGIKWQSVTASTWTKTVLKDAPGSGKDRSLAYVARMFPDFARSGLTLHKRRKPHDGLADAVCLALYGIKEYTAGSLGRP